MKTSSITSVVDDEALIDEGFGKDAVKIVIVDSNSNHNRVTTI